VEQERCGPELNAGLLRRGGGISEEHREQLGAYEQKVLVCLRRWLIEDARGYPAGSSYRLTVEDVRIERTDTGDDVIILFREASWPECLFEFGTFAMEPRDSSGAPYDPNPEYAESWASVVLANFEESLLAEGGGLPEACGPEDVTWI
jgi:hypothetical protein